MPLPKQENKPIRVVLDTNILISALLFQKRLFVFFDLLKNQTIIPCFTETTFQEFCAVLDYSKFKPRFTKNKTTPEEIKNAVAEAGIIIANPLFLPNITDDPADNHILACALAAQAKFIISGDTNLLVLKNFQNIPILSPSQFLKKTKA